MGKFAPNCISDGVTADDISIRLNPGCRWRQLILFNPRELVTFGNP
jgi:hypothetical protein